VDQKKAAELAPLNQTLIAPDGSNPASTILELDELWSFVTKKTTQAWIWIALCRQTRQVVAYAIGDRSQSTCRRLWEAIPAAYRAGHCFTDFWAAYQTVIPEKQHSAVGKETGETARAGALEQYVTTTLSSVCPQNAFFLQVSVDA
jgi:insertion element IS1 protein InsB